MGKSKNDFSRYLDSIRDSYTIGASIISLAVVDRHTMFAEFLSAYLRSTKHWNVFSPQGKNLAFKSGDMLFDFFDRSVNQIALETPFELRQPWPDVILLNMDFEMREACAFLEKVNRLNRAITRSVVVYSDYTDYTHVSTAYNSAPGGFLSTYEPKHKTELALAKAAAGKKYISRVSAQTLAAAGEKLTSLLKKEREVFSLVQMRFSNTEIAERLSINKHSVENYISALYTKLGVSGRDALRRV
jgi:DNA-binding NarL/FixJ family response regulator